MLFDFYCVLCVLFAFYCVMLYSSVVVFRLWLRVHAFAYVLVHVVCD